MKYSIIVVAYNIENFIEQALWSCVFPDRSDYEVIVVANRSTDDTLLYINRVAAANPGVFKVLDNEENVGLGLGRNQGLEHATGDYILFLDGDDWFYPNILTRMDNAILRYDPEVVVFNHARFYEDGRFVPNKLTKILYEGPRETPEKRAEILKNFGVAWNKLYKRSFVEKHSIQFGPRFYEDIDWNFEVLLLATRFIAVPDVLISYRQRSGSITRSTDPRHIEILAQYHKVIEFFRSHPELIKPYGTTAYVYARNQCLTVLNSSERLPSNQKEPFLRELAVMLSEFRALIGKSKMTYREKVIATGSWKLYLAGGVIGKLISPVEKWVDEQSKRIRKAIEPYRWKYAMYRYRTSDQRRPLDEKLVLLESFWAKKIDCNPYYLALELEKRGYRCLWTVWGDTAIPSGYKPKTVRKNTPEYLRALASAKYLISNANFPDIWIKREGQVNIQTFHGTPLKFMGLDIIKTNPKEMNWGAYAKRSRRWDVAVSSNSYSSRIWRQNAPYSYHLVETGYPRNDILFSRDEELVKRVRRALGVPDGKKIALYAPTFREPDKNKSKNISKNDAFDAYAVKEALGDDYVLLIRGHYFLKSKRGARTEGIIDASEYTVTNEVCLAADLLITDYSSIMFDYACLKRPIVIYAYDYDKYASTRGMYFDIRTEGPGMVVHEFNDLLEGLASREFESSENAEKLRLFNERFCEFDDGNATKKLVDAVFPQN